MSFNDLPDDWPRRSLQAPVLRADVVDLCLKESDRARRSLLILLCDEGHHPLPPPFVINDLPIVSTDRYRAKVFRLLDDVPVPGVVMALGLPRAAATDQHVRSWARSARLMCERLGITLVGFHLATLGGVSDAEEAA